MQYVRAAGVVFIGVGLSLAVFGAPVLGAILIVAGVGNVILSRALRPLADDAGGQSFGAGRSSRSLFRTPSISQVLEQGNATMQFTRDLSAQQLGVGLEQSGVPMPATLLEAVEVGQHSSLNPMYDVRIRIDPSTGPAYETRVRTQVNPAILERRVPGAPVNVRVDSADPHHVWIIWPSATDPR